MNEITRIHIAKIPYNIEKTAKTTLEKYLKALQAYLNDQDVIQDIEQRMTEILADHRVVADGIITSTEVSAIIQQLGRPEDFIDQDDPNLTVNSITTRRLYRYPSNGLLGGVASGLAVYFNINVVWIRIIMLIIMLASFGTFVLAYGLMWIIIPAIKSPSDLLALQGKPITVQAIQQTAERMGSVYHNHDQSILKAIALISAIGLTVAAIITLIITAMGGYFLLTIPHNQGWNIGELGGLYRQEHIAVTIAMIVSGLLLASLFAMWAQAAFSKKVHKVTVICSLVIIVLGLASASGAILGFRVTTDKIHTYIQQHTKTTTLTLPEGADSITNLEVRGSQSAYYHIVNYQVTDQPLTATLTAFADDQAGLKQQPQLAIEKQTLIINWPSDAIDQQCGSFCPPVTLQLSGPSLPQITAIGGHINYTAQRQPALAVHIAEGDNSINIEGGYIDHLIATLQSSQSLSAEAASIKKVSATMSPYANLYLGNINQLDIQATPACPADGQSHIHINNLTSSQYLVNGQSVTQAALSQPCLDLQIQQASNGN